MWAVCQIANIVHNFPDSSLRKSSHALVGSQSTIIFFFLFRSKQWSEHLYDGCSHCERTGAWSFILDDFALAIHQELCEVPGDSGGSLGVLVVKFTVQSEVLINVASVLPIHFGFLKHRKIYAVSCPGVLHDLLVGARLLASELVAREGQNLETLGLQLGVELN